MDANASIGRATSHPIANMGGSRKPFIVHIRSPFRAPCMSRGEPLFAPAKTFPSTACCTAS
ncbi:hypothetical protein CHELA20_10256 [Hyphomicrobiales bacterium]|nr:hypothetical protein CHELA20_10256 [Hyphomicrobiales bacterium]CAH1691281.1 hypothetical protein CHELA41_50483 [Hyphomicrobiales bacterium]